MHNSMYIYRLIKVFSLSLILFAGGCAKQYVAESDADHLVAAMQDLPDIHPYLARVTFHPVLNVKKAKSNTISVDSRNLKEIIYPELEMLNLAGHASIFRWFGNDGQNIDAPVLNIHARVFEMSHSIKVGAGRMQPIVKTKLEIFITDSENNRIYESFFTAKAEGRKGKLLRDKRTTQEMYGYAFYKALALAFDQALGDIAYTLNLKSLNFDIDNIKPDNINIVTDDQAYGKEQSMEITEYGGF